MRCYIIIPMFPCSLLSHSFCSVSVAYNMALNNLIIFRFYANPVALQTFRHHISALPHKSL